MSDTLCLSKCSVTFLLITSCSSGADARRRAAAFGRALAGHVTKLRSEPSAYGGTGLSELLGMREECLREFGFKDVYRSVSIFSKSRFSGESGVFSVVKCRLLPVEVGGMLMHYMMILVGMPPVNRNQCRGEM